MGKMNDFVEAVTWVLIPAIALIGFGSMMAWLFRDLPDVFVLRVTSRHPIADDSETDDSESGGC
jgi:hypothetical protein